MRILVIAQYYPPRGSTFTSRWSWLTAHLALDGHRVDVVALMSATRQLGNLKHAFQADPPPDGVTVRPVLPVFKGHSLIERSLTEALLGAKAMRKAVFNRKVDVVVASAPTIVTMPIGWLAARVRRTPYVLDLRDAWPELVDDWRLWNDHGYGPRPLGPVKGVLFPVGAQVVRTAIRFLRSHADAVIVTTDGLARLLEDDGVRNVHVVRNTSARPWPAPLPPPELEQDELHVLYIGNVGRAQLLATAVRAAAIAKQRGVPLRLRIVGSGFHWQTLQKMAADLDAPVEFHNRVPTHQVLPHYQWCDTAIVMLRGWESMNDTVPSKLYEVLLSGRHVSASVPGETARLVAELQAGDVVPVEDPEALATLWGELQANRERLHVSRAGGVWVREELSVEKLSRSFEEVLQQVARG